MKNITIIVSAAGFLAAIQILSANTWVEVSANNIGVLWSYISILLSVLSIVSIIFLHIKEKNNELKYQLPLILLCISGVMTLINILQSIVTRAGRLIEGLDPGAIYFNMPNIFPYIYDVIENIVAFITFGLLSFFCYKFVKFPHENKWGKGIIIIIIAIPISIVGVHYISNCVPDFH